MTERTMLEKQLAREIERLKRRNRTLINRIKRLTSDNSHLTEEIDILEMPIAPQKKRYEHTCTVCSHEMEYLPAGPVDIILCKNIKCNNRIVIKK